MSYNKNKKTAFKENNAALLVRQRFGNNWGHCQIKNTRIHYR